MTAFRLLMLLPLALMGCQAHLAPVYYSPHYQADGWPSQCQQPAAKDAIAQILTNSRMCAEGHRPICQDTGIVTIFVKWGQNCRLESDKSLQEVVDEGVRRAYLHPDNRLRRYFRHIRRGLCRLFLL